MAAVDAVVFDLDDTLVDWRTSVHRTAAEIAGEDLADRLLAWAEEHTWVRRDGIVVARNTWQMAEFAEQTWPAALPELDADELALVLKRFRAELWVSFFPEVVPTLDQLVDRHRLALLSNNPYLHAEVHRLRLHDWFEVAIDLPRDQTKPDPLAFPAPSTAWGPPWRERSTWVTACCTTPREPTGRAGSPCGSTATTTGGRRPTACTASPRSPSSPTCSRR